MVGSIFREFEEITDYNTFTFLDDTEGAKREEQSVVRVSLLHVRRRATSSI